MAKRLGLMALGIVLLAIPHAGAQDVPPTPAPPGEATAAPEPSPVVTERLAEPYSIDLLPDEPVELPPPQSGPAGTPATAAPAPWGRKVVTGDLVDRVLSSRELGITFGGRVTQFGFGIAGGIDRPAPAPLGQGDVFKYTGRSEYDVLLDLEKLGGPAKGRFLIRAEQWYGEFGNVSLRAGTFAPPVFAAFLPPRPNQPGVPFLTDFFWTQPIAPNWVLYAGKKDILGTFDQDIFAGGDGTEQFSNQALVANPVFLLGMPYSSLTAGFISPRSWGGFGAFVLDPRDRSADFFGDNLFGQGIIVGGEIKVRTSLFDMPGQQHVGGVWKHNAQNDLRFAFGTPGDYPETPVPNRPVLYDSFAIYYGFDQYLVRLTERPDRGWGLFGRAAISDGNPNPVRYFLSTGLGGFSPFGRGRGDTFGIGWYLNGASDQFGPVSRALLGPRNGTGIELYYNVQVTPWLNVTPDVQWIRPGTGNLATDNAFIYGLRVNFTF